MTQLAILSGIYGRTTPDLVKSFPLNLVPVVEDSGISKGYLRLAPGVRTRAQITGADRGGTDWNGAHYRVVGDSLVSVASSGAISVIGFVGPGGRVQFARSFDRLAIASGKRLFYLQNGTLTQVTDPDLGDVLSLIWVNGFFMTTDGDALVVTQLNDPTSVDPQKYGSSEADPDPIVGLLLLRNEVYALNGNTIEVFKNSGSTGFPFVAQQGAQIPKGCVGRDAYTLFVETFAFCGSGRNEAPAVYLAGSGQGIRISPRALDDDLGALSAADLASVHLEAINGAGLVELRVHLPEVTWCYDWTASQQLDQPVWHRLGGAKGGYAARGLTYTGGEWWVGSDTGLGTVDATLATVLDEPIEYAFDTVFLYANGSAAIVHALELVGLFGRDAGQVFMSYTDDGLTWSMERAKSTGAIGARETRPTWRRIGRLRNWRSFRFRGTATAPISFARLEAELEALGGG